MRFLDYFSEIFIKSALFVKHLFLHIYYFIVGFSLSKKDKTKIVFDYKGENHYSKVLQNKNKIVIYYTFFIKMCITFIILHLLIKYIKIDEILKLLIINLC